MNQAPVSVVVIAKNEERQIAECLEAVAWAKEIIVVDDASTDRTVEIARRYTDNVITRKMDIEGRHRNYAYSLATQPWLLSLDADERVTPALRDEILRAISSQNHCNGYTIPRKNFLGTKWLRYGGQYPSAQLKLFRQGVFRYEEAEVHPVAYMADPRGALTEPLWHYTYRDIGDFVAKVNRQSTLEAQKWSRDGRRVTMTKALWRAVDRFFRTYVAKQGFRDGFEGFLASVFAALYQILSYAKYRELQKGPGPF